MKILFLSRWFPYPPDNGSKIRIFNLLRHLSTRHEVDLISFATEAVTDEQIDAMRSYCQRVDVTRYHSFQPDRLKALLGFFSWQPRSFIDTHSAEMQNLVEEAANRTKFDLVIASEIDSLPYALAIANTPKILDELQIAVPYENFANQRQPLKKMRYWLTWLKLSHYITKLLSKFDGYIVVSEQEYSRISQTVSIPCPAGVVPNGVDLDYYQLGLAKPIPNTLVYSGALTFNANFDAVEFFLRDIFPLIQAEQPQIRLAITGKLDGVPVDRLPTASNKGVVFTGYLPDIRPTIARSWISIVPLRLGGGTRLKILEALALGTPVVTTSKGAEGLNLVPERDILIADTPADFAAAVLRLLQDATLREALSQNGRRAVETQYDWQIIGQQFNSFIETIVAQSKPELQLTY